jgi:hypothetical protein
VVLAPSRVSLVRLESADITEPSKQYSARVGAETVSGRRVGARDRILETRYSIAGPSGVAVVTLDAVAKLGWGQQGWPTKGGVNSRS